MNAQDRLTLLNAAGTGLAALGEGTISLNYDATVHPNLRFAILVRGDFGADYVGHGRDPAAAFCRACERRDVARQSYAKAA